MSADFVSFIPSLGGPPDTEDLRRRSAMDSASLKLLLGDVAQLRDIAVSWAESPPRESTYEHDTGETGSLRGQ